MSYWLFSNTTHILIALGVEIKEHFKRNVIFLGDNFKYYTRFDSSLR